jgi:glycosyltransferase involved in cell wall biosynthesis
VRGVRASRLSVAGAERDARRLLVISHPAVVNVNQVIYRELLQRGWAVTAVVPSRWRHGYSPGPVSPEALQGMESALRPTRVMFAGHPQRHVYLARCRSLCKQVQPDVAFVEAEPYALSAAQWGRALARLGIPFGVQGYENIDRELPAVVRRLRSRVLRDAAFVAARSESAARLVRAWGAVGEVDLAPPAVPGWEVVRNTAERPFTVGYAGRLIESKGLIDLLEAVRRLDTPVELAFIGDGELLPSRTTPTWKEQFGRAIVEALWCGVPVVGSDSGEIPWLIELTGGGLVFAEGDRAALAAQLAKLRADPELRRELAATGRAAVERLFSVPAATDRLERLLVNAADSRRDSR